MPLNPGSRLGSHLLVSRVRSDAWGEIWRARNQDAGATVSIHVLPSVPESLRPAAGLGHPNLRSLHDLGSDSGVRFLVFETLSGETLAERLARSSLPIGTVLELASGIASGLEALHRVGVVHGNLDPEKVFLADGAPKLVDYGFGRTLRSFVPAAPREAPVPPSDLPPNFGFLSPEEIRGERADARSDVFSFGAILDEMVAGPISLEGKPVPSALRAVITRCLAMDPAERYPSAIEARAAIDEIVSEHRASESSRLAFTFARRRQVAAGWAIVFAIGLVTLVDGTQSPAVSRVALAGPTPAATAPTDVGDVGDVGDVARVASSDMGEELPRMPEHPLEMDPGSAHGTGE
jgi:serine/threonine protein kinase